MKNIPVAHFNLVFKRDLPALPLIAVFYSPKDFKEKYVARMFYQDVPTPYMAVADDLESIREKIPCDLIRFPRSADDDISVVESWL